MTDHHKRYHHSDRFDFDRELLRLLEEDRSRKTWALLDMARSLREISQDLHAIRGTLDTQHNLTEVRITLMPKTIVVGGTSQALLKATNADGSPFTLSTTDSITVSGSNAASASFSAPTFNSDGTATVTVTGLAVDTADTISAVVDGVSSNTDTLTVNAAGPASVTLTLQ